jgi:VWFA-related protein
VIDAGIRCVAVALLLVIAFASLSAAAQENADPYQVDGASWREAIRAAKGEKPIVVFFEPELCGSGKHTTCDRFTEILHHPANQRRLADVVFLTRKFSTPGIPAVAVYDPSGALAMRWLGLYDATDFGKILNLIEGASRHLAEIARAHDAAARTRASTLAALDLGNEAGGRAGLEAMRTSSSAEERELATIWLLHIDPPPSDGSDLGQLTKLGQAGATDRVRFEARMAAGALLAARDRGAEASSAFTEALDVAASADERKSALAARERVTETSSLVLGLGSPGDLVFGRRTIQPRAVPKNAARVEFRLDGRLVATAKRAPFTSSVNFGRVPKRQVLSLAIVDKAGRKSQHASVVVNERSDAFSVQIAEPAGSMFSGEVDVAVSTHIPRGAEIASVVVEWNGVAVARFTSPPYRTRLHVGDGEKGILRAAVRLDDGSETEDVRLANSLDMTLESEVNLVEVPAYLENSGITADQIVVREGGRSVPVDRLISAADAPLRIALVLDRSGSMAGNLLDLQEAALQFVENNLSDRDETMVVEFGSALRILAPTHDRSLIEHAILRILPKGRTSLHDAMITALMRLQVSGCRRALVVFSDGLDTSSIFSAGDVAEVARRIGVPIYVLSFTVEVPSVPRYGRNAVLVPSPAEKLHNAQRELAKVSTNSGGKAFRLRSLDQLSSIWNEIGVDLRKQSLVIYRTDPAGPEWRPLELSLAGGRRVRAPAGVYVAGDSPETAEGQ